MSTLRISDAPLLPDVDGTEKLPTGGRGDYAISVDQIKDHIFQDVGKELVGLGNVDNTSDLDKPVSTAQQAALDLKADKTYVDTNLNLKADKTNVYTRSETSLALSQKADLVNGVIPESQIPSSFNDVLEFTTSNLPIVGESGKIYVTTDNNKTWRWGGNQYVEISGWNPDSVSKSVTLPTYYTKDAGVDPVTGVENGAYFNVRSSSDESYIDEYKNVGGVATPTGKRYLSSLGVQQQEKPASTIKDASGNTQQEINNLIQVPSLSALRLISPKTKGEKAYLISVIADVNKGGGVFVATQKASLVDNGGTIVASANPNLMWVRIGYEKVNPYMFGALGNGLVSDADAFHRTAAFSKGFEVLPGNYNYDGDGIDPGTQHWKITGSGVEKTKINLSANSSLIKTNYPPSNIEFVGFHTVGGLGALRFTNTGNLVGGRKKIKNNKFENYTKCAISSEHNDMPYWDIEENIFSAASSIGTMGVALGRNSDCSNINKNAFLKNEVHLKFRYSGKINIKDNDFLMFDKANTTGRAHIWLLGQAATPIRAIIKDNKFGNENQLPTDYPVFIGAESTSTGTIYDKLPDYSGSVTDSGIYRLVMTGNDIAGASGFSSVIRCAAQGLRTLIFDHNEFGGTFPALLVDMVQGADPRYCNWAVGSLVGEFLNAYNVQITNANNINISYRDDVHSAVNPNKAIIMTSLDSTLVAQLLSASITSFSTLSATKNPAIDVSGGSDAVTFEQTATGGSIYSSVLNPTLDSRETWLEFDVDKSGIETPISLLTAYLTNEAGNVNYLTRIIDVSKITSKARIRIPVSVRESFRIRFTSGSAGSVRIGRVRCYQSQYPVEDVHATLRSLTVKSMQMTYADDVAAKNAGIRLGELYCKPDGSVRVRMA